MNELPNGGKKERGRKGELKIKEQEIEEQNE